MSRPSTPHLQASLFLQVFEEMTPATATGLSINDWLAYVDVIIGLR